MIDESTNVKVPADPDYMLSTVISKVNEYHQPDLCRQCASIDLDSIANGHSSKSYRLRYLLTIRATCRFCDLILCCLERQGAPLSTAVASNPDRDKRSVLLHHAISETQPDLGVIRMILQGNRTSFGANMTRLDGFSNGRPVIPVTIPAPDYIDFETVRDWVARCCSAHGETCGIRSQANKNMLHALEDFRVINCDAKIVVPLPQGCDYATLSYIWGSAYNIASSLSRETPQINSPFQRNISLRSRVPKTIADAMDVVLRLGMKYLWVDKYCIDQTNPIEKNSQLSAMDIIYEIAHLTIILAAGDATSGLPGVTTTSRSTRPLLYDNGKTWVGLTSAWKAVEQSSWSSRAWTYQEGLCSVRKIVFTDEEVLFECNVTSAQETDGLQMGLQSKRDTEKWRSLQDCSLTVHIRRY